MSWTLTGPRQALVAGTVCWALSLLLAAPGLRILADPETYPQRYQTFARQVADPFVRSEGKSWDGDFMAFRILVPIVANSLGAGPRVGVAMIWLAGLLTLVIGFVFLRTHTSIQTAWLTTVGLAMTPLVQGSHIYVGYPDSVGWLIVMALIAWPRAALWAVGTFLMLFNDERGVLALPLALAVVVYGQRHRTVELLRAAAPYAVAVAGAIIVAAGVRWAIATGLVGGAPVVGAVLPHGSGSYGLRAYHAAGFILAFKIYWALVFWVLALGARERGAAVYWGGIVAYTAVAVYVSAYVFDFWRSLAALFPLVLLSVRLLHDARARPLARWLPVFTVLMVLLPQLEQMNTQIRWLRPLPVAVYEWAHDVSLIERLRSKGWL